MSDQLKHECGIAMVRLLKPLSFYQEKYGDPFYGLRRMYLLMEKQHNRGQDGAGLASVKFDVEPGLRYISRVRSNKKGAIQDIIEKIEKRIAPFAEANRGSTDVDSFLNKTPYVGNLYLGHVRYGTFGANSLESVHPFLRQSNWMHRNLIVAGNFNMTNTQRLFGDLLKLGQHPKEKSDTVTVMEKIGHFVDDEVRKQYKKLKKEGISKSEASSIIGEKLSIEKILRKSAKNWDGGYVIGGLLGHGDAFVLRDSAGIRPAYYYVDDEVAVVASERPTIQTTFNVQADAVKELGRGSAIIIKKDGGVKFSQITEELPKRSCSFERIYFSRGNDAEIYKERKELGKLIFPKVLKNIGKNLKRTVFSYIPNTAETSFYGMLEKAEDYLNEQKTEQILAGKKQLTISQVKDILGQRLRIEKLAIKDAKLRTFITRDEDRNDLVEHVYDITYGVVKPKDSIVIIDDSIVRGTTLKRSIIKILDRLNPEKIIILSSAPQIRYPDCYGIDMARLGGLIAFKATIELLKDQKKEALIETVYENCIAQRHLADEEIKNLVKEIYEPFTDEEISAKIAEMLKSEGVSAEIFVIFQTIENLHKACPNHNGDWYFSGNYPTPGGNRVVNNAFINYYENNNDRPY